MGRSQYLILNVICGYTSMEIADAFDDTVVAVTKRIQRAKKKMKGFIYRILMWMASNLEAKIFIC
ncbi:hypothetical protein JCM10914A_45600 [Paenibacillus sp. JCM 10914]|uniref:hypothetical protein n=1 Tax=Paenibacillus sp. JCM 10914 TaxID=1236974 RepID=UPI0003CC3786|nr:hypothetical protein [Paenibacillus sp. JCM 10914]GAE09784.1 hypothetical protein JCM10914_6171 [Paenibacillus sp. JCM 10914]